MVIVLCAVMMVVEIVGGFMFGSIALVADGLAHVDACERAAARGARLQLRAPACA